jgi:gluconate 2-dehydrogenase gamma chain
MAGQSLERREVLRILALAATASGFPGFSRWSFGCGHGAPDVVQIKPSRYTPRFFSADEYATVERLTEMIIPSDGTPGAREAGVAEFVDFMVWSDPSTQYKMRYGLTWLDAHARKQQGQPFATLSAETQTALLQTLAYKDQYQPGGEEGREFFDRMRELAVMGFYTSRIGLEQLDYPGLKIYTEVPDCPHAGNPEHRDLPTPRD